MPIYVSRVTYVHFLFEQAVTYVHYYSDCEENIEEKVTTIEELYNSSDPKDSTRYLILFDLLSFQLLYFSLLNFFIAVKKN